VVEEVAEIILGNFSGFFSSSSSLAKSSFLSMDYDKYLVIFFFQSDFFSLYSMMTHQFRINAAEKFRNVV